MENKKFMSKFSIQSVNGNIMSLFLAIFFLEAVPVFNSIYLMLAKKPVPLILDYVLFSMSFLIAITFFMFYFTPITRLETQQPELDESSQISNKNDKFVSQLTSYLLLTVLCALANQANNAWFYFQRQFILKDSPLVITMIPILTVVTIIFAFMLLAGFVLFIAAAKFSIPTGRLIHAYFIILKKAILKPIFSTIQIFIMLLGFILTGFIQLALGKYIASLFPSAFLVQLISILLTTVIFTILLSILTKSIEKFLDQNTQALSFEGINLSPVSKYAMFAVLLGIIILIAVFTTPRVSNVLDQYELMTSNFQLYGSLLANDAQTLDISAYNYRKAYSMILAEEGFLKILNGKADAAKENLIKEGNDKLKRAIDYDTGNIWPYIIRGHLAYMSKDYKGALNNYKVALNGNGEIPEVYYGMLYCYKALKDKEGVNNTIEALINRGYYSENFSSVLKLSSSSLNKRIEKIEPVSKRLFTTIATSAFDKLRRNDGRGAWRDLYNMLQEDPENSELQLYYGLVSMIYKNDRETYDDANEAFDKFAKAYPNDDAVKIFRGRMYLGLKDFENAAATLKNVYNKYPDIPEVSEQYANALLAISKNDEAKKVSEEILTRNPERIAAIYINAMADMKLKNYKDSIAGFEKLISFKGQDDQRLLVDEYLYSYCLAYSLMTNQPEAVSAIESISKDSIAYNYIFGTTAWRDGDYAKGPELMQKIIKERSDLGYPYFLLGTIIYEKALLEGKTDYEEAEKNFLKAVELQSKDINLWFSLAGMYGKWKGHEAQALRAYRRIVDIEPYSDHVFDHYGVTLHAYWKIDELTKIVGNEVK